MEQVLLVALDMLAIAVAEISTVTINGCILMNSCSLLIELVIITIF